MKAAATMCSHPNVQPRAAQGRGRMAGFTLIEVMITVAIIAVLSMVAYPSYSQHTVHARRATAAGCVLELAQFMERVYATNLRYDTNAGSATALPATACRTDVGDHYDFAFATGQPQERTFTIEAVPKGAQASNDTACATLRLDQANIKGRSGSGPLASCWR